MLLHVRGTQAVPVPRFTASKMKHNEADWYQEITKLSPSGITYLSQK